MISFVRTLVAVVVSLAIIAVRRCDAFYVASIGVVGVGSSSTHYHPTSSPDWTFDVLHLHPDEAPDLERFTNEVLKAIEQQKQQDDDSYHYGRGRRRRQRISTFFENSMNHLHSITHATVEQQCDGDTSSSNPLAWCKRLVLKNNRGRTPSSMNRFAATMMSMRERYNKDTNKNSKLRP